MDHKIMEHFGFLAYRQGNKKIKELKYGDYTVPIRQYLQGRGFEMPKILNIINNVATITVESEWIEGIDFLHLTEDYINKKISEAEMEENYRKWGVYMAKMHSIKNAEGLSVASHDLQLGNVIKANDGRVMLCDFSKLYYTNFPEEEIVRYILLPYGFNNKFKDAFMQGYLTERNISVLDIINQEIHYNWDNYQDIYCNGELIHRGPRSNKRLQFLPKDFTGLSVADLGCSCGMLAREAKRRGAKYVLAIEKQNHDGHMLIDLVAAISYAEGLDIHCLPNSIEDGLCLKYNIFDIIFFCAVLGHLQGDRFEFLKMLNTKCKIMYFETNLGGKEGPHRELLTKAGFRDIECLGESGDPEREENSHYTMFKCKGALS